MRTGIGIAAAALVLCAIGSVRAEHATPPRGALLFENRCARCHGITGDGDGGLAPSLIGVFGRRPAFGRDYVYSDALKATPGVWDGDRLDRFLANPQAFAPGTDMDSSSPDPADRAAIIDYIKTLR